MGQQDLAVEHLERAIRLSPVDPQRPGMQASIACAHFAAGRFDIASTTAETAMLEQPKNFMATIAAAATNAMTGNLDVAKKRNESSTRTRPEFEPSKNQGSSPL